MRYVTGRGPLYPRPAMLVAVLVAWALLAVAFAITAWIVPGMDVTGGFWGYLWVSALFGLVNAVIGTILRILTLPLAVITFGLFTILVNAFLLWLTDALTSHLELDDFWWDTIWAAIVLSVVTFVIGWAGRALVRTAG
jgi:putative membrane protein